MSSRARAIVARAFPAADDLTDRAIIIRTLWIATAFRLVTWCAGFVGQHFFQRAFNNTSRGRTPFDVEHFFWNGFFRWDASYYAQIAQHGYFEKGPQSNPAFFPLFPYLARYIGTPLGEDGVYIGGLVVSNLSSIGACVFIALIGKRVFHDDTGVRAVLLLLCFPAALFLTVFYSEGLFLLCVAASMYCFIRERWLLCGLIGALAASSRSLGVTLVAIYGLVLLVRWLRTRQWSPRWLAIGLIPLGLVAVMLMQWVAVDDPLRFLTIQESWKRELGWPLAPIWKDVEYLVNTDWSRPFAPRGNRIVRLTVSLVFVGTLIGMALRRYPLVLVTTTAVFIGVPLCSASHQSIVRLCLVAFPSFLFLARELRPWPTVEKLVIFTGGLFLALYFTNYLNQGWAG